jgi:fatty-acyl-CoA synthase
VRERLKSVLEELATLGRLVRTGHRAGLLRPRRIKHPLEAIARAIEGGVGVQSIHAIHAAVEPERPALVDARRTLNNLEADREISAWAGVLRDRLGASRNAPVAVMMDNRVEYAITWMALVRLGITCAHVSRYSRPDELEPLLQRSGAKVLVVSDATVDVAREVIDRRPDLQLRLAVVGGAGDDGYEALVRRQLAGGERTRVVRGPSENVVYTSGTTGKPKGAVRNFSNFGLRTLLEILDRLPMQAGDRHLVVAPLYHSGAQVFTLLNAALGSTVVLQDKFEAEETLRWMSEHDINSVFMVPTMIQRLVELPESAFVAHPTPNLRVLISGAAPFLDPLRRRAVQRFGPDAIFDFYGATELGWVTLANGREMMERPTTLGRAIPGQEIAIFDKEGQRLEPGEVGIVYTRSVQLMQGYLQDDEATDEIRNGDWLTVDDLGYLDDDGYLFLTGRARDMVISGGINIYPVEIETALLQHPRIQDVAVVGVPDEQWGERLVAFAVLDGDVDDEALAAWAKGRLSPYKVPRQWVRLDALPRNPTGKVLKHELRIPSVQ